MKQFVNEHQPDIMVLNSDEYDWLMDENALLDISDLVSSKDFDREEILPAVMEYLKTKGNGRLYGLAPTFFSTTLFYNKDLFDELAIPYQTNHMTWDEVFHLAKRFVGQVEGVNGISQPFQNDPFNFVKTIAEYNGVKLFDHDRNQLVMDSPDWRQIFELIVNAYKNKLVYEPSETAKVHSNMQDEILSQQNVFLVGQSAMTVDNYYLLNMIEKGSKPVNWDVVTVPIDERKPDTSNGFFVSSIFAINLNTSKLDMAWEFMKFVNGDDFAQSLSKSFKNKV
ncbi:ABC transporter substrate-binding protein [Paenibacillus yanchengensis]|uniref:ABC transporter substrate-binding protein n=1 Tax=Paenibacillus yanchengensis TaxID=2035833 RepID=A0ABW4YNL4_9BACL